MPERPYLETIDRAISPPDLSKYELAVYINHDQLNLSVWPDWVQEEKPPLIFIESKQKGASLPYHKKKLSYVLSSQRHFALECAEQGFPVVYLSSPNHYDDELERVLNEYSNLSLTAMQASEWDTRERLAGLSESFDDRFSIIPNTFFLADPEEWKDELDTNYRMEYFYREMRKRTGYLMTDEGEPEGDEWNYDDQNREKLPKNHPVPDVTTFEPDEVTQEVTELVEAYFPDHFGNAENFCYAVTREQALQLLDEFIDERLDEFGPYEDALAIDEHIMFHSNLSLYLNNGLLMPREICDRAEQAYYDGKAPINSVEGLIRQLIGWREFIHIYYEAMMPEVREANHFGFTEELPELFWSGETNMKCMEQALKPVLEHGYSHHIPRLMVLSNFSNLTKTDPRKLNEWFWFAYVDAYEWVTLPNVLGMSTFADGGVLGSKPYVSSGNYINKMSNYCRSCEYSITKKTGENACPFNYLYWDFIDKERETFNDSGRVNFMVNMYEKKSDENKQEIAESTERFLSQLKRYEE